MTFSADDESLQEDRWEPDLSNPDDRLEESALLDVAAAALTAGTLYYQRRSDLRAAEDFELQHGQRAQVDQPFHFGPELPEDGSINFGPELPEDGSINFGPEPTDSIDWDWPEE